MRLQSYCCAILTDLLFAYCFIIAFTRNQDLRSCSRIRDVALWDLFWGLIFCSFEVIAQIWLEPLRDFWGCWTTFVKNVFSKNLLLYAFLAFRGECLASNSLHNLIVKKWSCPCYKPKNFEQIHWSKLFCRMFGLALTTSKIIVKIINKIQIERGLSTFISGAISILEPSVGKRTILVVSLF